MFQLNQHATDSTRADAAASDSRADGAPARLRASFEELHEQIQELFDRSHTNLEEDALECADDIELITLLETYGGMRHQLDALGAHVSAELGNRSRPSSDNTELCREYGYGSAAAMIEVVAGCSRSDARALVKVGQAISRERWLTGDRAPATTPHVREALEAGQVGLAAATQIVQFRENLAPRVDVDTAEHGEAELTKIAPSFSQREFRRAIQHLDAMLDPDGLEPRIEQQRDARSLVFGTDAAGMTTMRGKFDPETGATIRVALEGFVTQQLRAARGQNVREDAHLGARNDTAAGEKGAAIEEGGEGAEFTEAAHRVQFVPTAERDLMAGPGIEDRSIPQLQADALAAFCAHIVGCDLSKPLAGASVTAVVRIPVQALEQPVQTDGAQPAGICEIDGFGPIDAGTARRMAAAAAVIPIVLGEESEVLDLGRTRRQFSRAQRIALVERDGGCAFCGLPPGMTEAHHRRWWIRDLGPTDLENGVLLCTSCHHRVHEGWDIIIVPASRGVAETLWFLPPAHIDPARTPRLGGRKRFDAIYRSKHPPQPPPYPSPDVPSPPN